MFTVAILTLSDKGARGEREDETGRVVAEMVEALPGEVAFYEVLPDEQELLEEKLKSLADDEKVDLILTNGGTGLSPRDITPEATARVIERHAPGIVHAMMQAGLEKTSTAMLSRATAGVRKRSLIINLPGSPKAARESLTAILPALAHGMDKIRGDEKECAPLVEELRRKRAQFGKT